MGLFSDLPGDTGYDEGHTGTLQSPTAGLRTERAAPCQVGGLLRAGTSVHPAQSWLRLELLKWPPHARNQGLKVCSPSTTAICGSAAQRGEAGVHGVPVGARVGGASQAAEQPWVSGSTLVICPAQKSTHAAASRPTALSLPQPPKRNSDVLLLRPKAKPITRKERSEASSLSENSDQT